MEYGYYEAFPSLQNGNRVVKILLSKDVPDSVRVENFDCRVWYSRQPPQWPVCRESDIVPRPAHSLVMGTEGESSPPPPAAPDLVPATVSAPVTDASVPPVPVSVPAVISTVSSGPVSSVAPGKHFRQFVRIVTQAKEKV